MLMTSDDCSPPFCKIPLTVKSAVFCTQASVKASDPSTLYRAESSSCPVRAAFLSTSSGGRTGPDAHAARSRSVNEHRRNRFMSENGKTGGQCTGRRKRKKQKTRKTRGNNLLCWCSFLSFLSFVSLPSPPYRRFNIPWRLYKKLNSFAPARQHIRTYTQDDIVIFREPKRRLQHQAHALSR